jgi:hypothetical protein
VPRGALGTRTADTSQSSPLPRDGKHCAVRTKPLARRTLRVACYACHALGGPDNPLSPSADDCRELFDSFACSWRKVDSNPIARRARRKRQRLTSNGSIESDAAARPPSARRCSVCAASLPIESYRLWRLTEVSLACESVRGRCTSHQVRSSQGCRSASSVIVWFVTVVFIGR